MWDGVTGDMGGAFMHRGVDLLAAPAGHSVKEGDCDGDGGVGSSHAIGEFTRRLNRWLALFSADVQ